MSLNTVQPRRKVCKYCTKNRKMKGVGGFAQQSGDVVIPRRHTDSANSGQNKTADRSEHVEKEVKRSLRKEASVIVKSAVTRSAPSSRSSIRPMT